MSRKIPNVYKVTPNGWDVCDSLCRKQGVIIKMNDGFYYPVAVHKGKEYPLNKTIRLKGSVRRIRNAYRGIRES